MSGPPLLRPPIICVSGPSGAGKTRLLLRLIAALTARGLRVAAVKHTRHAHPLDVPGKDTDLFRRAGASAAAIAGPRATAFFGPPVEGPGALVRWLPAVDVILAEGFRSAPLPRIEVHRRSVSRHFLCARDPHVFVVVGDGPPPRPLPVLGPDEVEPLVELLCRRAGIGARRPRLARAPAHAQPSRGAKQAHSPTGSGRALLPREIQDAEDHLAPEGRAQHEEVPQRSRTQGRPGNPARPRPRVLLGDRPEGREEPLPQGRRRDGPAPDGGTHP